MRELIDRPSSSVQGSSIAPLHLQNWPLRYERRTTLCLSGLAFFVLFVVAIVSSSVVLALTVFAAALVSLWRAWIPVSFELGPTGITQRALRMRSFTHWSEFSCYEEYRNGLLLMRDPNTSPLARLSGSYIHSAGHRSELLAIVGQHVVERRRT